MARKGLHSVGRRRDLRLVSGPINDQLTADFAVLKSISRILNRI